MCLKYVKKLWIKSQKPQGEWETIVGSGYLGKM